MCTRKQKDLFPHQNKNQHCKKTLCVSQRRNNNECGVATQEHYSNDECGVATQEHYSNDECGSYSRALQ